MEPTTEKHSDVEGLKTTLHYDVGKICMTIAKKHNVTFSKEFIAILAKLTYRQIGSFAVDLEHFSNHAKRSTINAEDVKLLARKNKLLYDHISGMDADVVIKEKTSKKRKKKSDD
ncbi:centromere protein S-like [Uloborus diversus]|uniref:centromere protein S-like n=1 Tax=Uloborus diversus TaxID=327109 RepID=UPI00240944E6|nr:centromere protein S-like [Uloborus diversus]